jgi:hypothetical protein
MNVADQEGSCVIRLVLSSAGIVLSLIELLKRFDDTEIYGYERLISPNYCWGSFDMWTG